MLIPKIESNMLQREALFQIINSLDLITQGIEVFGIEDGAQSQIGEKSL